MLELYLPGCRLSRLFLLLPALYFLLTPPLSGQDDGTRLIPLYALQVTPKLNIPNDQQRLYCDLLRQNLADKTGNQAQYVVLVDRNKFVQAAMLFWMSPDGQFHLIGASPVSTGKSGQFDHFITPTGVFEHTLDNPDFRAEGTLNENGIRGYGARGMRVYDFGWQQGVRGWGSGGESTMRLQMHATDPDRLERKLGTPQSKGCVRIPSTLNVFLDHYGILDEDYEKAMAGGSTFWVLPKKREPTPWSGKFLVVVETARTTRPKWSPAPR